MLRKSADGRELRIVRREQPMMSLSIELGGNPRHNSHRPGFATVEWAGRVGHPSSYGLVGGTRSNRPDVRITDGSGKLTDSLAGRSDNVIWGLLAEYEDAIRRVIEGQPFGVLVTKAAHGEVGSSEYVFRFMTSLLCTVLAGGLPDEDEEVWRLFDRLRNEARGS